IPRADAADGPRFAAWIVGVAAIAAGAVRLWSLRPLWVDEADTVRVTGGSFRATLDAARTAHAQPPLNQPLRGLSRHLLGSGTLAIRLPEVVAGVLLIPVLYITGAKLFDRRVGLIAALLVAIGPGFVWLSDEAQTGALAALLTTVSVLTLVLAVRRDRL